MEEANVDMIFERIDVSERRISHACDRAAIVHQLSDIVTALAHPQKPLPRDGTQLDRAIRQPSIDGGIPCDASGEPENVLISNQSAEIQSDPTRSAVHIIWPNALPGGNLTLTKDAASVDKNTALDTQEPNDEVERRAAASTPDETELSRSSTAPLAHRSCDSRDRSNCC
ncbi:MAG TPA: hypothetical protein VHW71_02335 [Steroidobacteraceae bacterium]|jgi:hypothetical protein|nr:hypothetical protein [Steroidobacteraceae bacterium]